jgi:hypothetical protein
VEHNSFKTDKSMSRASGTRRFFTPLAIVVALVLVTPTSASADGVDIVWLITRVVGSRMHPALAAAMVVGLLIVNYVLNLVVLGMPAARFLQIKVGTLTKDLAGFTLLAQIADRACAVGTFFLSYFIIGLADIGGEQEVLAGIRLGIYLNFIFSGLAVGLLALWYLRRRWGVERRRARAIAVWTAVITNPAWAMMIQWFIARRSPF